MIKNFFLDFFIILSTSFSQKVNVDQMRNPDSYG